MQTMIEDEQRLVPVRPRGGLLPAGRVVLYLIACLIGFMIVGIPVSGILYALGFDMGIDQQIPPLLTLTLLTLAITPVVVIITLGFVRFVDHRPVETLGISRTGSWAAELWFGILLGFGLPLLMFLIAYAAGWTRIMGSVFAGSPAVAASALVQAIVLMGAIGILEEFVMRGYVLQTLRWGYGVYAAIILSSVFFGSLHLFNPGGAFPGFLGTTAAGLLLGYTYLVTGRLWMPIGLHFAWNFALGHVFGFPVSGIEIPAWIEHSSGGPAIWTGGVFGPEAGLLGLIALAVGVFAVKWFKEVHYRSGIRPSPEPATDPEL